MSGRRDSRHSTRPWPLYVLALVTAGVVAVGIIELGPPSGSSARTSSQTVTVGQGVVQTTVTGTGNVEPATDDDVDFDASGTLEHVYVSLGQHVYKGQLIATLNHTPSQITLDEADLALTKAQSALSAAEAETPGTVVSSSTSTPSAGNNSEVADTNDSDTQENTTMIRAASDAGSTSTSTFTSPTTPASTTPPSTTPASTTPASTTPAKTTPASTTPASTTPASTTPSRTTPASTTPAREPSSSRTPSSSSKSSSSSSGSSGSSSAASHATGTVLTAAEIAATVAQDNLTVAQDTVTRNNDRKAFYATWLHAPVSGTIASLSSLAPGDNVTAGTTSNVASSASSTSSTSSSTGAAGGLGGFAAASSTGSSSSNSGSSSSGSSSPFAEIVNTSALTMSVPLSESDISQVSDGQPATISLDALPSVELAAHVSAISPTATTSSGVVSYNVTLTMDQTNSQVKPGMSASASIIVKQASGVTVPVDALTGASSLATVNLKKGSATVPTQVVVGLRGTNDAQIVSGLSPGEQIVVKTTLPALNTSVSSGSSSTSSGTLGGGTGGTGGFAGRGGGGGGGGGGGFAARLGG